MASKHKRGTDRFGRAVYEVKWRDPGERQPRGRRIHGEREAEEFRRIVQRCEDLGILWEPEAPPEDRRLLSVQAAVQAWLNERKVTMSAATHQREGVAVDMFLRCLQDKHDRDSRDIGLDEALSRKHLVDFVAWLRDVRDVGDLTVHQYLRAVERAWRWLFESDEYGEKTPRPRRLDMEVPPPALRPVAPTWAEMDAAIAKAWEMARRTDTRAQDAEWRGWLPMLWTIERCMGLRRKQALGIDYGDFDWRRGVLVLPPRLCKTMFERRFCVRPVPDVLRAEMALWKPPGVDIPTDLDKRTGRVVPAPRKPHWTYAKQPWIRAGMERVARQQNHAFRRGHFTGLQLLGASEMIADLLQGRRSGGGTGRQTYLDPEKMLPDMRAAAALVPPMTPPPPPPADELTERRERG